MPPIGGVRSDLYPLQVVGLGRIDTVKLGVGVRLRRREVFDATLYRLPSYAKLFQVRRTSAKLSNARKRTRTKNHKYFTIKDL